MWTWGLKGETRQILTSPWSFFVALSKLFNFRDLNTHHCTKFFFKLTAPWRICMYVHPRVTIYVNELFLSEMTVGRLVQFWPPSLSRNTSSNALRDREREEPELDCQQIRGHVKEFVSFLVRGGKILLFGGGWGCGTVCQTDRLIILLFLGF